MSYAELNIPNAPTTGHTDFDNWLAQTVKYLRDYLGSYNDRGDPAAADFDEGDLTMDASWNDLDLSGIVPEETKAVVISAYMLDGTLNATLKFRKNGNSNEQALHVVRTTVAGVGANATFTVACDSSRVIEYYASEALTTVAIRVTGWFK